MTKIEIIQRINELNHEICGLVQLAKQLGNKKPYENFLIKDRIKLVNNLKKQLDELETY